MALSYSPKYYAALASNLPPGKIWRNNWLLDLLKGASNFYQRVEDYSVRIFVTEMVDRVETYLSVWGEILAIPNPSAAKVRGKLGASFGQNIADYEQLISQISEESFEIIFIKPARCGMSSGSHIGHLPWAFTVILEIASVDIETVKSTIEKIEHAHVNFLYLEGEEWTLFG